VLWGIGGTFIVARSGHPLMRLDGLKAVAGHVLEERTGGDC
jgi:hypothetical protein